VKLRDLWLRHSAINETIAIEPGEDLVSVGRTLRAATSMLRLCCPIRRVPRSKSGWRKSPGASVTRARGGTGSHPGDPDAPRLRPDAQTFPGEIQQLIASPPPQLKTQDSRLEIQRFTTPRVSPSDRCAGRQLATLAPTLVVTPEEIAAAKKKFAWIKPAIPSLPQSRSGIRPRKRWPADRFIARAREIQRRTNCAWLILGGKGDLEFAGAVADGITQTATRSTHLLNLAGQTSLRELMALLKSCRVLLTNDSGPMHVAAALGTPVIVPFGSTSPELTGPGLPGDTHHHLLKSDAPCTPCFLRDARLTSVA